MIELGLMLAKVIPFEMLVEQMEDELAIYKADPTAEKKEKFVFMCTMIAMNKATEGKDIGQMMRDASDVTRIHEQLKSAQ